MNNIETLFQKYTDPEFVASQFDDEESLNILFVNPTMSGNNFYKMILPSVLMKNLEDVATAVIGTQLFDVQNPFITKDVNLTSQHLLWANVIVFPFTFEPIHIAYKGIRSVNPTARILFNVDFNCWEIPENHSYKKMFSDERLATIDTNIVCADGVIVDNALLGEYLVNRIRRLVTQHNLQYTPTVRLIPLAVDIETLIGANLPPAEAEKDKKKLKLLAIVTATSMSDFKIWAPVLKEIVKLPIELTIFGMNEGNSEFRETMKGIHYTSVNPTSLLTYYDKLASIKPDMLLNIHLKSRFNELSGDYKKMIDAALFNAPIISVHQYPYSTIIDNGKTGYLLKDPKEVLSMLTSITKDPAILIPVKETVHEMLTEHFTDTPKYYEQVYKVFSE